MIKKIDYNISTKIYFFLNVFLKLYSKNIIRVNSGNPDKTFRKEINTFFNILLKLIIVQTQNNKKSTLLFNIEIYNLNKYRGYND